MEELLRQIAGFKEEYERDVLRLAQELRGRKLPELTEELFSEFERNGNRLHYEAVYFGRRKFLSVFGLVCVMRRGKEDVGKLEEVLLEICREECWALPAHVDRRKPDWRVTIDLFASETAQTLAQLVTLLGDELSEPVAERVKREVETRVLAPFMASRAPYSGWERSGNNWNAVCCGNIGSAGLLLLKEGAERRALAERLAHALTFYLKGFGDDGACEEGLGYWAYGLTYFMLFARQLREVYPDMDILAGKKQEAIACFQQKCYFRGGRTVSFSDGSCFEPYSMGLTCSLAYGIGRAGFWRPGRLRPGHWRTAAARSFRMCSGRFSGERVDAPPSSRAGITRNPTITMMWAASFTWRTGRRFWTIWAAANIRRNISRIKDIRFSATGEPATISL